VCALDTRGHLHYQVGVLKDSGDVAQPGGTKAIVRVGWNAWVFGSKSITVYSPHCLADALVQQVCSAATLIHVLPAACTRHACEHGAAGRRAVAATAPTAAARRCRDVHSSCPAAPGTACSQCC
jgi:hypothetical protein